MSEPTAKLMTVDEIGENLISLAEQGFLVPVWAEDGSDICWWPTEVAPVGVQAVPLDEVRAFFSRTGPPLMSEWN